MVVLAAAAAQTQRRQRRPPPCVRKSAAAAAAAAAMRAQVGGGGAQQTAAVTATLSAKDFLFSVTVAGLSLLAHTCTHTHRHGVMREKERVAVHSPRPMLLLLSPRYAAPAGPLPMHATAYVAKAVPSFHCVLMRAGRSPGREQQGSVSLHLAGAAQQHLLCCCSLMSSCYTRARTSL